MPRRIRFITEENYYGRDECPIEQPQMHVSTIDNLIKNGNIPRRADEIIIQGDDTGAADLANRLQQPNRS